MPPLPGCALQATRRDQRARRVTKARMVNACTELLGTWGRAFLSKSQAMCGTLTGPARFVAQSIVWQWKRAALFSRRFLRACAEPRARAR
ncbi:hypothetical protein F751_4342 [Auxenochlorella protothecoides]|uniref:Uncharacterized protein n=1 Tax=Auxenochlorella protothecoides TaxID=3075 RepID=A0A087ST13_AUXPR|nr:hypothetical protein F751_4342 [Auxenochlorella protothecoides]KFM28867.1 hypothetical protein F751_4342 [Auxenochlorella protothecoides]